MRESAPHQHALRDQPLLGWPADHEDGRHLGAADGGGQPDDHESLGHRAPIPGEQLHEGELGPKVARKQIATCKENRVSSAVRGRPH